MGEGGGDEFDVGGWNVAFLFGVVFFFYEDPGGIWGGFLDEDEGF